MTDIVIVNWNSGDYLNQCINSIFVKENISLIGTIIVIDNNSFDSSLNKILSNDKIRIIKNNKNLGFARACNQGFRACTSKYVLLLNPDAQLKKNTLSDCDNFLELHSEIDILGCQLLNEFGSITASCSRFPSPKGFLIDAIGLSKLFPGYFKPGILMTDWNHKESRFVDQLMGAFMFMRRSIFEKVGYFDERFFVYFEEVDFSIRLKYLGGKSYFNSYINATHIGEGTTKSVKAYRLFLSLQSRMLYAKKHFTRMGILMTWITTFLIEPLSRIIFLFLQGKFREIASVIKGYFMLIMKSK